MTKNKPLVGVSGCVIGQQVRFDNGHKRSSFVDDTLRNLVQLMPICPEMGIGLGTPRPTIRLREINQQVRLMDDRNHLDHTEQMQQFTTKVLPEFAQYSGFIVCAKSPSCGMERVKVLQEDALGANYNGRGLFTAALMARYPLLPVEENGRLNDPYLRENFVMRILLYQQAQLLLAEPSSAALQQFHQQHKLLLLAHNEPLYRQLGPLLSATSFANIRAKMDAYLTLFMAALAKPASRKGHTNALQHIQGYFKSDLEPQEKKHLHQTIMAYHSGQLPLMAPISIIDHILTKYPKPYITQQSYLHPTPEQLALRCHL